MFFLGIQFIVLKYYPFTFACKTFMAKAKVKLKSNLDQLHESSGIQTLRPNYMIAAAIFLVATNALYRTQWKGSHYATTITIPAPIEHLYRITKKQIAFANCAMRIGLCRNYCL